MVILVHAWSAARLFASTVLSCHLYCCSHGLSYTFEVSADGISVAAWVEFHHSYRSILRLSPSSSLSEGHHSSPPGHDCT